MRSVILVFAVCFGWAGTLWAQVLTGHPATWSPGQMLQALSPALQSERLTTVEMSLAAFPGSSEFFLTALISPEFLEQAWQNYGQRCGPLDPAPGLNVFSGRSAGWYSSSSSPQITLLGSPYEMYQNIFVSPLIIDLNRDGIPGTGTGDWRPHQGLGVALDSLVPFDINGDGFTELTEWVNGEDALLLLPTRPEKVQPSLIGWIWNGPLSGYDLLGTAQGYQDGFLNLRLRRDLDGDGIITAHELQGLYAWTDTNVSGTIEAGELFAVEELGITQINLPALESTTGSYTTDAGSGLLWDWWPSYALTKKLPVDIPTESLEPLHLVGQPLSSAPVKKIVLAFQQLGLIARSDLETAGLNWNSANVVALAPDGSRIILADQRPDPNEIQEKGNVRIWSLTSPGTVIQAARIDLPLANLHQAVFIDNANLLCVGDAGSRLIAVNLDNGAQTLLMQPIPGQAGFRAKDYALRSGARVYLTGYFYNADQEGKKDAVVRLDFLAADQVELQPVADLTEIHAGVRTFGTIAGEFLAPPERGYYVVQADDDPNRYDLVAYYKGHTQVVDQHVSLRGLAAEGSRVLYFANQPDGQVEVRVYDDNSPPKTSLVRGDYYYPYLSGKGKVVMVSEMTPADWTAGTIRFYSADLDQANLSGLQQVYTAGGIGALRVAEDGRRFAYLEPAGLKIGCILPAPLADLNLTCQVNLEDWSIFASHWLATDCALPLWCDGTDLNQDGLINLLDLSILGAQWLTGRIF